MIGRGSGSFPVASLVSVLVKRLFWVSEQLDVNSLQTTTGEKSVKHGGKKNGVFPSLLLLSSTSVSVCDTSE